MDRRTLLLGFLGGLGATPTIIAASSSVEAAPVPEPPPPAPEPLLGAASPSAVRAADLETVQTDWSQGVRRRVRRRARRMARRTRRVIRRSRY